MPPKDKATKKAVDKQKQKIIEDKTFGLKNKNKSKKVEAYVKSVTQQVQNRGQDKKAEELAKQKKEDKARAEAAKKEMFDLFKPVVNQKVPLGVDPKSVLCELFKAGACPKGAKCKFSHDPAVERKNAKIDLYTDRRAEKEADTMDLWTADKLASVVDEKQGQTNRNLPTKIVCKYFLDAIEQKKYGWFWECPNGGDKCMYVHALPPGFVLKAKKIDPDDEEEGTPIEEIIEEQRKQLTTHTPVTKENFLKWKEEKRRKKEQARKEAEEKRLADIKAGKTTMSGREMFVFNPDVFVDDDAALDMDDADLGERGDDVVEDEQQSAGFLGNDGDETTTTTTSVDELAAQVDQSLFVEEDLPDDDE